MEETVKNRSDVSIVLLFFIFLSIFGVSAAGFIVDDYARARASQSWPVYEGIILSHREGGDKLRYVYSINGRSHESSRLNFFTGVFSSGEHPVYGPGETVSVYVDPGNPSFSVLYPGGSGFLFIVCCLVTGAFVFFGFGGIVRTLLSAAPDQHPFEEELSY